MRLDITGRLTDERAVRAGFIGCGSHAFRNIYPTFQYAPVDLVATCDLSLEKAEAFARQFGAQRAYSDYRKMLENEKLDVVFIVTGYDNKGRPLYPQMTLDCLKAGCHVWVEKPPAASVAEIEAMQAAQRDSGKNVVVGMKKMFFPINEKAKELAESENFGHISMAMFQYPQYIPAAEQFEAYNRGENETGVRSFLDHLCHPVSLMVFLLGMPKSLYYERSYTGAGNALFTFPSGAVASLSLTHGAAYNGAVERTVLISERGGHIVLDNNIRLSYHQGPPGLSYGRSTTCFTGTAEQNTTVWEPEFSLGQLYNKGLFLLGYYNEVNEFACSVLDGRPPSKGTLDQAWQVTRIFEKFADGPGRVIVL